MLEIARRAGRLSLTAERAAVRMRDERSPCCAPLFTEGSDTSMGLSDTTDRLRREELAWELVEVFGELRIEQINEVLAKNVPLETLEFFSAYADEFADSNAISDGLRKRLPNLLLLGYLLRVLEERLIDDGGSLDA
jgi:hypothetical protein